MHIPRSANFGGLWERSVNAHLTFKGLTMAFTSNKSRHGFSSNFSFVQRHGLSLWQRCTRMQQILEYLHQIQNRPNWLKHTVHLRIGDLILLKEDGAPI